MAASVTMSQDERGASLTTAIPNDSDGPSQLSTTFYIRDERTPGTFLGLPLELRRQIYECVFQLSPRSDNETNSNPPVARYSIDTAILRVSKEIHYEARQILYDKDGVVVINMDSQVYEIYGKNSRLFSTVQDRCVYPLFKNRSLRLGGSALLNIILEKLSPADLPPSPQPVVKTLAVAASFICFCNGFEAFCRDFMLTCRPEETEVHFRLRREASPPLQGVVLHNLGEVRGFGAASLADYHLKRFNNKLAMRMMTPIISVDELLKGAKGYEHVYRHYLQQDRFSYALCCADKAFKYLLWSISMAIRLRLLPNDHKLDWGLRVIDVMWQRIFCSIKLRFLEDAYDMLMDLFSDDATGHAGPVVRSAATKRNADGHYYFGLIALARNSLNAALYSFFRALCESPGHQGACHEINVLEARSASTQIDSKTTMLRHNIATINDVRRQITCTSPVDLVRIRELEKDWMGIGKPPVFHEDVAKKHCFLEFLAYD